MSAGHSQMPLPTGRIVVLAEMEDGTVRAIDGEGHGLIDVVTEYVEPDWFGTSLGLKPMSRTTTVTVTYPGQWTMYTSTHREASAAKEIEPSTKEVDK